MEIHNSRARRSPSPPQEDGKREMWRRVEEGEHDWRGESGRRIRLGKNGERGAAAGLGSILGQRK